jgi:hypothetical protein
MRRATVGGAVMRDTNTREVFTIETVMREATIRATTPTMKEKATRTNLKIVTI